jgi:phospholipid N-methyltransferase
MPDFEVIIPDYLTESETEETTAEMEEQTDYSESLSEIINQTNLINENLYAVQGQNEEIITLLNTCISGFEFTSTAIALSLIIVTAIIIIKIFKSLF